ncbi:MAG: hypothetical protein U1F43_25180 [Myxococcota bacterium]
MMFTAGYAELGKYRGVPIRWHWSLLVMLAVVGLDVDPAGGYSLRPLCSLFTLALILVHEAGHHAMIRFHGFTPIGVDLQAFGGETRWRGEATPRQEVRMAWAGVFAQAVALAAVGLGFGVYQLTGGEVTAGWAQDLRFVYIDINLLMICVNLVPLPTFDGDVAWKVVALWRGNLQPRRMILITLARNDEAPVDVDKVRADVDAELAALAEAHNERAMAETASRPPDAT